MISAKYVARTWVGMRKIDYLCSMNNLEKHIDSELKILRKESPDAVILEFEKEIKALCNAFANSGQSGGSAPFVAAAISKVVHKLMLFEPIGAITGEDGEWMDVGNAEAHGGVVYQNKRDGRVFKDGEDGRPYFIDAIIFDGDKGGRFHGSVEHNGKKIGSAQYIKEFPFRPKTFYVNVVDHRWADKEETQPDEKGDWWSHTLVDEKQLEEVFEYYDEFNR